MNILIIVGLIIVLTALVAQKLVRRVVVSKKIAAVNDVVGIYLDLVGAVYGIALAFIMSAAWGNLEATRGLVDEESQAIGSIAYLARGLPQPYEESVVKQARLYCKSMVDSEWPSLVSRTRSDALDEVSSRLGLCILRFHPSDGRDASLDDHLLDAYEHLRAIRRARRLNANYQIPTPIWILLGLGSGVTIGLCFLLELESATLHYVKTGMVSAFLVTMILVTWDLQNPFRGFNGLSPKPFQRLENDRFLNEDKWNRLRDEPNPVKVDSVRVHGRFPLKWPVSLQEQSSRAARGNVTRIVTTTSYPFGHATDPTLSTCTSAYRCRVRGEPGLRRMAKAEDSSRESSDRRRINS